MTRSSSAFSTVSILLMTSTLGAPDSLMRPISSCSCAPMFAIGSTTSSTASTSATLSRTTLTI